MSNEVNDDRGPFGWMNWRAAETGADPKGGWEYTFYTDAHVSGQITEGLGPYQVLNATPATWLEAIRPAVVLRATDHLGEEAAEIPEEKWSRTDYSLDWGGFLDDEIAALLSLTLGVRFFSGGLTRDFGHFRDDPLGHPYQFARIPHLPPPQFDRPILPGMSMWRGDRPSTELKPAFDFLAIYPRLSSRGAIALLRSARSFQLGIWVADADPEFSWLRLVSSVEAAANNWRREEYPDDSVVKEGMSELAALLRERGGEDLVKEVSPLLANVVKAQWKFLEFLEVFLPDPPEKRPPLGQVDWSKMRQHLKKVYNWRSLALHEALPLPAPMCLPPSLAGGAEIPSEVPLGLSTMGRGAVWATGDIPMHLHVFAYVCRGALLNWWKTELAKDAS